MFVMKHFPLKYQNAYGRQTFQDGNMRRGDFTHKYAWHLNGVGHMTNKMYISTCRRCIDTIIGKMLTEC